MDWGSPFKVVSMAATRRTASRAVATTRPLGSVVSMTLSPAS